MVLAQAVLHIWADRQGVKAPTALDIAIYFETHDELTRVLEEQWKRIGLGLPFSHRLREASSPFFSACTTRAGLCGPSIAMQKATRALQPTEALKQARLKHLARVTTFPSKDPIEVRAGRHNKHCQTARPSKMKPDLPGFTHHEAFMLQIAMEAKELSRHHAILLHQAGKGFSEHFDTT